MAGEAAARLVEGEPLDPVQIGIAGATSMAGPTAVRAGRGVGRMARAIPSLFERAQGKAAKAGAEMVEGLRPAVTAPLSQAPQAAGGDVIPMTGTQTVMQSIMLPAKSANPKMEAVRTTLGNLQEALQGGNAMPLRELEAIRQDIGPLVGRSDAPAKLTALYGAMVKDLENAAEAGGVGASLAREAATAFKQELGASKIGDLIGQATTRRVSTGAEVPALNVGTLSRLVNNTETRKSLVKNIGPDTMKVVDRFIHDFRALPPEVAFSGFNRMILTIGGAGGGAAAGTVLGGVPGAFMGALTPELITNMSFVGRNPRALNQLMQTVSQATRASMGGTDDTH